MSGYRMPTSVSGFLRIDAWVASSRMGASAFASCSSVDDKGKFFCQHGADGFRELLWIVKLLLQFGDRSSVLLENQAA